MSTRISPSNATQLTHAPPAPHAPPVGGPVKLPAVLPIPVPEQRISRVEMDLLELSATAAKRTEARISAQLDHDRELLDARGEERRKANLEPQKLSHNDERLAAAEQVLQARSDERRKLNLAPTTAEAAKVQGAGNKVTLTKIDVHG
jgi:hypothetical protein